MLDTARKSSKTCQIEGCHETTVGSRTALCRKHRNNRYKQNYKKKKRRAQGSDEIQSESIESQLAEEKCLMEQKYASMLQQVLAEKQLELLQSEKVIQALKAHQKKVKENKIKEMQERKVKKEQEPLKGATDQDSSATLTGEAKDGHVTEKATSKTTKTSKNSGKTNHNKKSLSKGSSSKDMRVGNNLSLSGNMANISTPSARTLYTGVSISPFLAKSSGGYVGQNPYACNVSQQMASIQPVTMATQHIPKIDKVFSYQQNVLNSVSNSGVAVIDSVKDLSLGPQRKVATSVVSSFNQPRSAPSSSKQQNVHTRLPQNPLPYQAMQKVIFPSANITSQAEQRAPSFQSCSSTVQTTGGSHLTAVGMAHQSQMSFPVTNFSPTFSLPTSCQITTTQMSAQDPQTSQVVLSQPWSSQIVPGRLQAPAMQDDFLLQMLQENKEPPVQLGAQSQANSALPSLDHVITDPTWAMTIGM